MSDERKQISEEQISPGAGKQLHIVIYLALSIGELTYI